MSLTSTAKVKAKNNHSKKTEASHLAEDGKLTEVTSYQSEGKDVHTRAVGGGEIGIALPLPSEAHHFDPETEWQKPWPKVSKLLYKTPIITFGPFLLFLIIAVCVGVGSAYVSLNHGSPFHSLESGVWVAHPLAGTKQDDPYSTAIFARTLRIPLGSGEGLAFYAVVDDAGRPLDPTCTYEIEGRPLPARLWTLTAADNQLHLLATDANRAHLNSSFLIRNAQGGYDITLSPQAVAGNWLPSGGSDGLVLVLRLYDTPLGADIGSSSLRLPAITRSFCQ
ncbi:DUF1214 domain-containing protein [Polycladidibacter stylochi]|uniref:DUF1214 domain-containing protein n=1 Tax=Polycladidibacter stylochi TaxID=1807766 RepID=UPI0009E6CCA0|nr:DUF1214 domain-containing protein [Pseudovibrio stylochi]